jgi:hypothetical protein
MSDLTPKQRAAKLVTERAWDTNVGISGGTWTVAIAAAIRDAERLAEQRGAEAEREAVFAAFKEVFDEATDAESHARGEKYIADMRAIRSRKDVPRAALEGRCQ